MSDAPPQLGNIHQTSDIRVPGLSSTSTGAEPPTTNLSNSASTAKDNVVNSRPQSEIKPLRSAGIFTASDAQAAANTVANHPTTQSVKESIQQAPVTGIVKDQSAKTSNEFNNLTNARKTPTTTTATEQPLTHYHSFFYTLLSWENPRVTAIAFASTLASIFALRYLPVLRWTFKALYLTMGVAALAEGAGKSVLSKGFVSAIRPRRYFTIDREFLESCLEDFEQFINFFVIETQRLVFAEKVAHTTAAFVAALLAYWLIKFTPLWGVSLIAASTLFLGPLIYITNREVIDELLGQAGQVVTDQTAQIRDLAGQHTATATKTIKGYSGEYVAKAQEMLGATGAKPANPSFGNAQAGKPPAYKASDFPAAPQEKPMAAEGAAPAKSEPLAA